MQLFVDARRDRSKNEVFGDIERKFGSRRNASLSFDISVVTAQVRALQSRYTWDRRRR